MKENISVPIHFKNFYKLNQYVLPKDHHSLDTLNVFNMMNQQLINLKAHKKMVEHQMDLTTNIEDNSIIPASKNKAL